MQTPYRETRATHDVLRRLPEFEPDPALWSRVVAAHGRQANRVRHTRARWIGSAIAAVAAAFFVLPRGNDAGPLQDEVTQWQLRSQALELQWQDGARTAGDPRVRAELRLIDVELQAAYDRGAATSEVVPLWKQRSEALHSLINNDHPRAPSVTRI